MANTIQALPTQFTPYTIRLYFWAIINDGHDYLGKQLLKQHFALGTPKFPTSLLNGILYDIRFQCPSIRNNFPEAWKPPPTQPACYTNNSQKNTKTSNNKRNQTQTQAWGGVKHKSAMDTHHPPQQSHSLAGGE
jgi:hypothetical protein